MIDQHTDIITITVRYFAAAAPTSQSIQPPAAANA